jgi:hypothetical protein
MSPGHLATLFSASTAFFRTATAMLRFVLGAFGAAGVADVGAHAAEIVRKIRTAAHQRRRRPTDFRTITVQPNTFGHHLDVGFAQACGGAMFASLGAAATGFDAGTKLLVTHNGLLLSGNLVPVSAKMVSLLLPYRFLGPGMLGGR